MVKLGGKATDRETTIYHALQDAAVDYADCYRTDAIEQDIHKEMIKRFKLVEKKYDLKDFAESATLHHSGGGTSPLGNRDRMLDANGDEKLQSWTQFAINPVDSLVGFKVELQGVIQDEGAPAILDMSKYTDIQFRNVKSKNETQAGLPELLII